MTKYIKKCVCCGKLLGDNSLNANYCDSCIKMYKSTRRTGTLSDILFAIAMIACAIAVIVWSSSGAKFKDLENRVHVLEQTAQSTK